MAERAPYRLRHPSGGAVAGNLPYDPMDWDRRLAEARLRRQEALKRRDAKTPETISEVDDGKTPRVRNVAEVGPPCPIWAGRTPWWRSSVLMLVVGGVVGASADSVIRAWQGGSASSDIASGDAAAPSATQPTPLAAGSVVLTSPEPVTRAIDRGSPTSLVAKEATEKPALAKGATRSPIVAEEGPVAPVAAQGPKNSMSEEEEFAGLNPGAGEIPTLTASARTSVERALPDPEAGPAARSRAESLPESNAERDASNGWPAPPQTGRVIVHVPSSVPRDLRAETAAVLRRGNWPAEDPKPSPFTIRETHVRYYHAQDRQAAERLAGLVSGEARNFTSYRPRPDPGLLELWLAGKGPSGGTRTREQTPPNPAQLIAQFLEQLSGGASRSR